MADKTDRSDKQQDEQDLTVQKCMPCRGTGIVISNLGGTAAELPCPWCSGTGRRQPDVDAQAPKRAAGQAA